MAVTDSDDVLVASTALGCTTASSSAKQRFLDVQALDDGLDHQIAIGQFLHAAGDLQPLFAGLHRRGVHAALFDAGVSHWVKSSSRALAIACGWVS